MRLSTIVRSVSLALTLSVAAASVAAAQTSPVYTYGGIPWGSSAVAVKAALATQGFTFNKIDDDGDYWFDGHALGYPARIYAFMSPTSGLCKIQVLLATPDADARSTYQSVKGMLSQKYGPPTDSVESFLSPYYDGDGYENTAIRVGKGLFLTIWGNTDASAPPSSHLDVEISKALVVNVAYESKAFHAESLRRKAKSAVAF